MELSEAFFKKHITFTAVNEIARLAAPLEKVGITYFSYDKSYNDGTQIRLTNHEKWTEHYYRAELYKYDVFENNPEQFCSGHVFWSWLNREPVFTEAAKYNIDDGLSIIQKNLKYCNFYHFGTARNEPLTSSALIKKINFLYRFINSFHEKAAHLIKIGEKSALPLSREDSFNCPLNEKFLDSKNFAEFLKKTEIKRLYLGEQFDNAYLTRREIDIVRLLIEGKKPVCLSQRTLEVHISHIKEKLKCNTLFELGYAIGTIGHKTLLPR